MNVINKVLELINKVFIPILVKNEMFNLLCFLLILNLKKIKKIKPKKRIKYKAIVLYKSGGFDDLVESQKMSNNDILYLICPRIFFKYIFFSIFENKSHNLSDLNYLSNEKKIINLKKKYKNFLVNLLKILKKKYRIKLIISFGFYFAERELHSACSKIKIPFLLLFKESIHSEFQKNYFIYTFKKTKGKFNGYKIGVYSKYAKELLLKSGVANNNQIKIIGCSRLGASFSYKKIVPKKQILYYAIQDDRGLPNILIDTFGGKFYRHLTQHKFYKKRIDWNKTHLKTMKILKEFAKKNPKIEILIKVKVGQNSNLNEYKNLPNNIKVFTKGAGHKLLKYSKVVIAWNTTSLLEGIAANRFLIIPYFHGKIKNIKKFELKLNLKTKNYGYTENDFCNKLNLLINSQYDESFFHNNLDSLEYYLGNKDNRAGYRLNNFIRNNLSYKKNNLTKS
tara:strand:- start:1851 stop:3203 length:1353 start_codon:yes stop_codon:yes gene_type:complete